MEVKANSTASAKAHASYIMGLGRYGNKQLEIQHTKSGNMPQWAENNPLLFWESSDNYERSNGNKYREYQINLPREFNAEQRIIFINELIKQELSDKHAYTYAIHVPNATDGKEQPHVHLMFSDRINDGIDRPETQYFKRYNAKNPQKGGCKKNSETKTEKIRKLELQALKDRTQSLMNAKLQEWGYDVEVDLLSSRESRGLHDEPNLHLSRQTYEKKLKIEKIYPDLLDDVSQNAIGEPRSPIKNVFGMVVLDNGQNAVYGNTEANSTYSDIPIPKEQEQEQEYYSSPSPSM